LDFDTEPFYLPIIPIIFKSKENLDNNYKKTIKNSPFIGYSDLSGVLNCGPFIDLPGAKPPLGPFYYTTLFTLYKSPEKKWHRSVKMDKNINVHFSKVPGKCCKRPLRKTRYEHNAANSDFSLKTLAAHFF
jgi:hypothetical protein